MVVFFSVGNAIKTLQFWGTLFSEKAIHKMRKDGGHRISVVEGFEVSRFRMVHRNSKNTSL